jgi:hypothetical protein
MNVRHSDSGMVDAPIEKLERGAERPEWADSVEKVGCIDFVTTDSLMVE